jgi:hypothetical protein
MKMKKKLIIGSILAVFLLMMFPSISALEYKAVEKAQEEELMKFLEVNDLDPKQHGIIKKLWRLILKIIAFPLIIIKIFLRLLIKIFRLPFKIFWCILDLITPFRDFNKCRHKN